MAGIYQVGGVPAVGHKNKGAILEICGAVAGYAEGICVLEGHVPLRVNFTIVGGAGALPKARWKRRASTAWPGWASFQIETQAAMSSASSMPRRVYSGGKGHCGRGAEESCIVIYVHDASPGDTGAGVAGEVNADEIARRRADHRESTRGGESAAASGIDGVGLHLLGLRRATGISRPRLLQTPGSCTTLARAEQFVLCDKNMF